MDSEEPVELTAVKMTDHHRNFVLATWPKSYLDLIRKGIYPIDADEFWLQESWLAENKCESTYVLLGDDQYTIYAWVCGYGHGSTARLYHCYAVPMVRGLGIVSGMIEELLGTSYRVHKPFLRNPPGHKVLWSPYTR